MMLNIFRTLAQTAILSIVGRVGMTKPMTGRCLCGAIAYSSAAEPMMMGHCHCEDCRRSSGSGHSSHLAVPEASVTLTGRPKGFERAADSGHIVTRYFCDICGAALYSKNA